MLEGEFSLLPSDNLALSKQPSNSSGNRKPCAVQVYLVHKDTDRARVRDSRGFMVSEVLYSARDCCVD
jgi:hypothetical protein